MKTQSPFAKIALVVLVVAALLFLPKFMRNDYQMHIVNMVGIYILLSLGLNIAMGYCGQINLAIGAFWAVGAYTSALLATRLHFSFWVTIPIAMLVAGLLGALVGLPSLKVRSHYLAIVTLGLGEVINIILVNEDEITNGAIGISGIKAPTLFGLAIDSEQKFYFLILVFVVAGFLVARQLVGSRYGRSMEAIRDDYVAAAAMGVNLAFFQILAFAVSAVFAAVAGTLYAHLNSYISPDAFAFHATLFVLTMTLIGGMGSLWGSVVGSVLVILQEYLRAFKDWQLVIYGAAVMLIVLFVPGGVMGLAKRVGDWRKARRSAGPESAST